MSSPEKIVVEGTATCKNGRLSVLTNDGRYIIVPDIKWPWIESCVRIRATFERIGGESGKQKP